MREDWNSSHGKAIQAPQTKEAETDKQNLKRVKPVLSSARDQQNQ